MPNKPKLKFPVETISYTQIQNGGITKSPNQKAATYFIYDIITRSPSYRLGTYAGQKTNGTEKTSSEYSMRQPWPLSCSFQEAVLFGNAHNSARHTLVWSLLNIPGHGVFPVTWNIAAFRCNIAQVVAALNYNTPDSEVRL